MKQTDELSRDTSSDIVVELYEKFDVVIEGSFLSIFVIPFIHGIKNFTKKFKEFQGL